MKISLKILSYTKIWIVIIISKDIVCRSQNAALLQGKTLLEVHYILAEKVLIAVNTGVLRKIDYSGTSPALVPTNSGDICL